MEPHDAGHRRGPGEFAVIVILPDFESVEANLRAAMRFFGEATGTGEVRGLGGVIGIYSGLDYGVFNIAMLDGPLPPGPGSLEERLARCRNFFEPRTARWSFWLCENLLPPRGLRAAQEVLLKANLQLISHAPGMMAEQLRPPARPLPAVECLAVADQRTREDFGALTAANFDIPMHIARLVYYPENAWRGLYRGFVGYAGGKPVSIAAIVAAADSLGVYSLATVPESRRRGYGEALLRAAVAAEQRRTGIRRLVLQSSEIGHALYLRMGFRPVAKFSVYLTR